MEDKIGLVIAAVSGLLGVPIVQYVKGLLGWEDKKALGLAAIVSLALGLVVVVFGGEFTGADITLENIGAAFTAAFTVATMYFGLFIKGKPQG